MFSISNSQNVRIRDMLLCGSQAKVQTVGALPSIVATQDAKQLL